MKTHAGKERGHKIISKGKRLFVEDYEKTVRNMNLSALRRLDM
jgi:hypothetical protein